MRQDVEWGCEGEENEVISMAEGARFENPEALESIGPNLNSSFRSQSVTEESEEGRETIETDESG